jgi:hypothetical protein
MSFLPAEPKSKSSTSRQCDGTVTHNEHRYLPMPSIVIVVRTAGCYDDTSRSRHIDGSHRQALSWKALIRILMNYQIW